MNFCHGHISCFQKSNTCITPALLPLFHSTCVQLSHVISVRYTTTESACSVNMSFLDMITVSVDYLATELYSLWIYFLTDPRILASYCSAILLLPVIPYPQEFKPKRRWFSSSLLLSVAVRTQYRKLRYLAVRRTWAVIWKQLCVPCLHIINSTEKVQDGENRPGRCGILQT